MSSFPSTGRRFVKLGFGPWNAESGESTFFNRGYVSLPGSELGRQTKCASPPRQILKESVGEQYGTILIDPLALTPEELTHLEKRHRSYAFSPSSLKTESE